MRRITRKGDQVEETKEWTIQVLDAEGNIKYQAAISGNEKKARSLCLQLEKQYQKNRNHVGLKTKKETIAHKRWF
ncbi:hypothetical protein [Candidatus Enterococcus myersii]|uniref:hypothetical protein n=1 Tax=Candidatus Enterococcus myersii TaxID=2815322 RepID=UPI001A8D0089|nr:hypothetical protein [Enterococcus sp. MJM12]